MYVIGECEVDGRRKIYYQGRKKQRKLIKWTIVVKVNCQTLKDIDP